MKIKPPKGYRLMSPDEIICHGDKFYAAAFGKWINSDAIGEEVSTWLDEYISAYARKTKPQTRAQILREIERLTKKLVKLPTE
jgi:hypothetical protein